MTDRPGLDLLVSKYFIAPHPYDDGIVEAVVSDDHCLVRYESSPDGRPEYFGVVALSDMAGEGYAGGKDEMPPWLFFDSEEQRAKYRAWVNQPENPNKPRVVPMRRPSTQQPPEGGK